MNTYSVQVTILLSALCISSELFAASWEITTGPTGRPRIVAREEQNPANKTEYIYITTGSGDSIPVQVPTGCTPVVIERKRKRDITWDNTSRSGSKSSSRYGSSGSESEAVRMPRLSASGRSAYSESGSSNDSSWSHDHEKGTDNRDDSDKMIYFECHNEN